METTLDGDPPAWDPLDGDPPRWRPPATGIKWRPLHFTEEHVLLSTNEVYTSLSFYSQGVGVHPAGQAPPRQTPL